MTAAQVDVERDVRRLCAQGDVAAAAVLAIRGYGPEILGFLAAHHRSDSDADEVFSLWSERLYRGLARFGWASSLRTWAYTVVRNASINYLRDRQARVRRERPACSVEIAEVEQAVRTETPAYLRSQAKDKFAAIRDALPDEDRLLLVLRVDKRLEWKDLARVMLGDDVELTDAALTREAQRLRKHFQLLKAKLVVAGKRAGLFGDDE